MMALEEVSNEPAGVTRHIYPASAMVGDYLRAAAGVVPAGVLFATAQLGTVAAVVLGGFTAIFAVFGLRTALRHGSSLEMTDTELREHGLWRRTITWAELDRIKLAYYSTARDRKSGWMQLELGAGGARVRVDSRIEGFDRLVRRAATAAAARRIEINPVTFANLQALGVRLAEPGAER